MITPELFYTTKGVIALIGALMLITHMIIDGDYVHGWDQRMRYLTLLGYTMTVTLSSTMQVATHRDVIHIENWMGLILSVMLIVTMIMSMKAAAKKRKESTWH